MMRTYDGRVTFYEGACINILTRFYHRGPKVGIYCNSHDFLTSINRWVPLIMKKIGFCVDLYQDAAVQKVGHTLKYPFLFV